MICMNCYISHVFAEWDMHGSALVIVASPMR